ncbi:MAG: protein phosphatase 2C domain-containing protein [Bacillota bacterium]|nr:protein phosphatase 2C domain-containing protein [Bacillota bacterium]
MKTENTPYFKYSFLASGLTDIGKRRQSNEDQVILCRDTGFFAVSDGMGGLPQGGKTSEMIASVLPDLVKHSSSELRKPASPEYAAGLLEEGVQMVSNSIFEIGNKSGYFSFGAALCGVWLVAEYAIFVNLGDCRGYMLPYYKRRLRPVTKDHNLAAIMVEQGELTPEAAKGHPSSTRLTRFVGMPAPAAPDTFIEKLRPGDRILLCSDGLHGMVRDAMLQRLMHSSKSPERVCKNLIDTANMSGGRDNISAVYIQIAR